MKGAFNTTTEDTYESDDGKLTVTLIDTNTGSDVVIGIGTSPSFTIDIQTFDELVSAVEVLQDRARARRMK